MDGEVWLVMSVVCAHISCCIITIGFVRLRRRVAALEHQMIYAGNHTAALMEAVNNFNAANKERADRHYEIEKRKVELAEEMMKRNDDGDSWKRGGE